MATQTEAYGVPGNDADEGGGSVSLFQQAVVLSKNIVAMALDQLEDGALRHVSLTALPTGTEVTIVGEGFNRRTVRYAATITRILFLCKISKGLIPVTTFRRTELPRTMSAFSRRSLLPEIQPFKRPVVRSSLRSASKPAQSQLGSRH